MKLQKDSYSFIHELLCDFEIDNLDCMTGFERKWLVNIREQFTTLYRMINER